MKHIAIKTDENSNWKQHIHDTAIKLNRADAMLLIIKKLC